MVVGFNLLCRHIIFNLLCRHRHNCSKFKTIFSTSYIFCDVGRCKHFRKNKRVSVLKNKSQVCAYICTVLAYTVKKNVPSGIWNSFAEGTFNTYTETVQFRGCCRVALSIQCAAVILVVKVKDINNLYTTACLF